MRPVDRGPVPLDAAGQARTVTAYANWRADLVARLGNYCNYCERPIYDSPQVEHVAAKSTHPALKLEWTNMLLACGACNRAKSDIDCPPTTHFLPDTHNTVLAFTTRLATVPGAPPRPACLIAPAPNLTPTQTKKAEATIELCALDEIVVNQTVTDMRWHHRWEASLEVEHSRQLWNTLDAAVRAEFTEMIGIAAKGIGFFSLWYAAYADEPAVKAELLRVFPGTALGCFDAAADYAPTVRLAGDL